MPKLVVYRLLRKEVGDIQFPSNPYFNLEELILTRPDNKLTMVLSKTDESTLDSVDKIPALVKEAGFVFCDISSFTPNGLGGKECFFVDVTGGEQILKKFV